MGGKAISSITSGGTKSWMLTDVPEFKLPKIFEWVDAVKIINPVIETQYVVTQGYQGAASSDTRLNRNGANPVVDRGNITVQTGSGITTEQPEDMTLNVDRLNPWTMQFQPSVTSTQTGSIVNITVVQNVAYGSQTNPNTGSQANINSINERRYRVRTRQRKEIKVKKLKIFGRKTRVTKKAK
jgi:hypothetical protein